MYVLKFWLLGQSFSNQDSFLNCSFLNQDFIVFKSGHKYPAVEPSKKVNAFGNLKSRANYYLITFK